MNNAARCFTISGGQNQKDGTQADGPLRVESALDAERRQAMSYSISTLLTRNLQDVFGENDPARRRAAIDEL